MPGFVNEKEWQRAKQIFIKSYNREPSSPEDFAIVTSLYKKVGGKISSEAYDLVEKIFKESRSKIIGE